MVHLDIREALTAHLFESWSALCNGSVDGEPRELNVVEYDPERPSPCHWGEPRADGCICWKPVQMDKAPDFSGLQVALGAPLHPDIACLYGSLWCGPVFDHHEASGEDCRLRTFWNEMDLEQTLSAQADSIRHMKRHPDHFAGYRPVLLVATTDSDLFFGLDNCTGEIVLEEPGAPDLRRLVAPSLAQFLQDLA
ncbi:SecY-interacting protein Syd [Streptomyces sp. MUM 203J]|uniref:SecY-interacting protein Syd n=1 Tax=Streptomyces sp. MUM 203J TaxID=2791990 RepID=UPI001F0424E8|nr:SecY-interacting protein Syd [Streptomyces sp. MUM 203J]MCH0543339.1 SecY-interacting protein Syd [Streptomyces sp. MUM 203J]